MNENKLPLDKHHENTDLNATAQTYTRSADTSTGDRTARKENTATISPQPNAYSTSKSTDNGSARDKNAPTISRQPDAHSASKGISPVLARVLTGGLIGLTLGTLAGAFANKKTAKAVNHAAIGVGEGAKTVAEGVNHSAKGVGDVVKSVADGVNYAVIGAVESLKDSAEDVEQSTVGVVDAVKDTSEDAKQFAVGAVKDTADAIKDTSENIKPSQAQNFKLDEDLLATGKNQVPTGEVSIGQVETQMPDILVVVETEGLVDENIPLDAETPVVLGEAGFFEEDVERREY